MCFHKVTPCVPASPAFPSTSFTSAALETETNSSFSSSSPTYSTRRRAWKPSWWATSTLAENHHWATSLSLFTFMHWRRKWQPTPVFLPGESQGRGAWWAAVCGVAQSRARLKWLSSSSSSSSMTYGYETSDVYVFWVSSCENLMTVWQDTFGDVSVRFSSPKYASYRILWARCSALNSLSLNSHKMSNI